MKKLTYIFSAVALVFSAISCQKELVGETVPSAENGKTISLTVLDEPWVDAKSAYIPGSGISLTGSEKIGVLYYDPNATKPGLYGTDEKSDTRLGLATPAGGGKYTFTAPEAALDCRWFGVVPFSYNSYGVTGNRANLTVRVGPVQFPQANSFDPMQDVLFSRGFVINGGEATITNFKRLTAPLRVNVKGLDEGEVILAATLSLSSKEGLSNCLNGCVNTYFATTDDGDESSFENTKLGTANGANYSNAISAVYENGLESIADSEKGGVCWPVWYSVLPMTIPAGTDVTMEVTTNKGVYTRTAAIDAKKEIVQSVINKLSFNIKGSGYAKAESVSQNFIGLTAVPAGQKAFTASDGVSYNWTFDGVTIAYDATDKLSGMTKCLIMKETSSIVLPELGSLVNAKNVKVYVHPHSNASSNAQTFALYYGDQKVSEDIRVNLQRSTASTTAAEGSRDGLYLTGGILEFSCPEGYDTVEGLTLRTSSGKGNVYVSRISFETEEYSSYYAMYEAGKNIVIGDLTVNKTTCPKALCVAPSGIANTTDFINKCAENDVVFIMDEEDGSAGTFEATGMLDTKERAVVIGDNPRQHPVFKNEKQVFRPAKSLYLKNLEINGTYSAFANSGKLVEDITMAVEDCQISFGGGINDNHATYNLKKVILKNNVICITGKQYLFSIFAKAKPAATSHELFDAENNVILYDKPQQINLVAYRMAPVGGTGYVSAPNLVFRFNNNTVYNCAQIHCLLNDPKSIDCNYNAFESDFTGNTAGTLRIFWVQVRGDGYTGKVTYNYFNYYRETGNNVAILQTSDAPAGSTPNTVVRASAAITPSTSIFSTIDVENGYLPVNTSKVTNGAGAVYSTKFWKDWE